MMTGYQSTWHWFEFGHGLLHTRKLPNTREDPDLMESSGRVKMLAKTMSWSGCRDPVPTEVGLTNNIAICTMVPRTKAGPSPSRPIMSASRSNAARIELERMKAKTTSTAR
jgi:hypothetical protein